MRIRSTLLAVVVITSPFAGNAQERTRVFDIRADRTQQTAPGVVKAIGNVTATFGDLTIRADSLEARTDAEQKWPLITAEGNVAIERGAERFQLRRLELDTRTGRGIFELPPQ